MTESVPSESSAFGGDEWVDIRMTDPEAGEWEVDTVVLDGRVQYVDLRVRPELLDSFVDCLVDDVGDERAREILETVAERRGFDELAPAKPDE
ncbi:hypothetical protein [Halorientalis salina]|uniref:hypothetical protein n=1 Tax=Halorientalis salina TaxID=2932266 RepID=UPI0010AC4E99|nr:hypothetical protein [Halorientalis salina]